MLRLFQRRSIYKPSPAGLVLAYLALGAWTLIVLLPLYWLVVTSLKLPICETDTFFPKGPCSTMSRYSFGMNFSKPFENFT